MTPAIPAAHGAARRQTALPSSTPAARRNHARGCTRPAFEGTKTFMRAAPRPGIAAAPSGPPA